MKTLDVPTVNPARRRLDALKARQKALDAALALELNKAAKHERRITGKLDALLGCAVRKAGAAAPEFRTLIAKQALASITDSKARKFLGEMGWL